MIRATLIMALDFAPRKGVPHVVYSYRRAGIWYVVRSGPKYCNTFRVSEHDEAGLEQLLDKEVKEESAPLLFSPEKED